jgi:hypothetical protein
MIKKLLIITLIIGASAFGAQKNTPYTPPENFALPFELQLKLAELKLDKINLAIAKGPTTNYKDLIVPTLGMTTGLMGILYSGSGALRTKNITDTYGASLLVSSLIFLFSYINFTATNTKETQYLEEKKFTQLCVIHHLNTQQNLKSKA